MIAIFAVINFLVNLPSPSSSSSLDNIDIGIASQIVVVVIVISLPSPHQNSVGRRIVREEEDVVVVTIASASAQHHHSGVEGWTKQSSCFNGRHLANLSENSFLYKWLLEPYLKGTYVTYPYLGSHYNRVLVVIRYI